MLWLIIAMVASSSVLLLLAYRQECHSLMQQSTKKLRRGEAYILHKQIRDPFVAKRLVLTETIRKKSDPVYVGVTKGLKVPILGYNYEEDEERTYYDYIVLPSGINHEDAIIVTSHNYQYKRTYLQHSKAVKLCLEKYDFDIAEVPFSQSMVCLKEGEDLNNLYIYGSMNGSTFQAQVISDDLETLSSHIAKKTFWKRLLPRL